MRSFVLFFVICFFPSFIVVAEENKKEENTYVVTCAIHFANDSVRFDKSRVAGCLKGTKVENVTYVHVFATASASGSPEYNLELSQKRADMVASEVKILMPKIGKVHSFGGGENPGFGRQSRIFIVVDPTPEQKAKVDQKPKLAKEPLPKIIVEQVEKNLRFTSGFGRSKAGSSGLDYNFSKAAFHIENPKHQLWGQPYFFGMAMQMHTNIDARDFVSLLPEVGTEWQIYQAPYDLEISYRFSISTGITSNFTGAGLDGGILHSLQGTILEDTLSFGVEMGHLYQSSHAAFTFGVHF